MDIANALQISSWVEAAKAEAAKRDKRLWLVRSGGSFKLVETKPARPVLEVYPGGRVVLWERD